MLFGKTIVVTGVASGIGARTAELAAQLGAEVIGIDVRAPSRPVGPFIEADLGVPGSAAELVMRLPRQLDALCNVAGVSGAGGIAATLAINFYGLRALTEALVPHLREGASVVNVASIAGFGWRTDLQRAIAMVDVPGFPTDLPALAQAHEAGDEVGYQLSKELLLMWTFRAAHQPQFKKRGIRVNAVSPGPVETPILAQFRSVLGDARVDHDIARVGRAGTSGEIAPAIVFLCSDGARWINGANIPVDGGLEASVNAQILGFSEALLNH